MKPQISIIIPIYNSSDYLEKCLTSIQNQTFKEFEVLLVNDGSTDNSLTICKTFAKIDDKFKVFTQKNAGVSSARNNGLKNASGTYICFVDSDDWIEKDYCKILLEHIISNNCDLVMCGYITCFSRNHTIPDSNNLKRFITHKEIFESIKDYKNVKSNILRNNVVCKLFKKNIINKNNIEFTKNFRIGEDLLFILEYQKHTNLALNIPDKLYYINRNNNNTSMTASYVKNYWEDLVLVKKKTFEINKDIVNYTDEYKYYQYINVATKAILEEGKLNNGKKLIEKYKSIKELCNKKEVRHFCTHYKLQNEKNTFYHLLKKLTTLNLPFVLVTLITCAYKFKII